MKRCYSLFKLFGHCSHRITTYLSPISSLLSPFSKHIRYINNNLHRQEVSLAWTSAVCSTLGKLELVFSITTWNLERYRKKHSRSPLVMYYRPFLHGRKYKFKSVLKCLLKKYYNSCKTVKCGKRTVMLIL